MPQAAVDEAVKSTPWMARMLESVGHNEKDANGQDMYVFDGPKGGIYLTDDQLTQMLGLAKEKVDTQELVVKGMFQAAGMEGAEPESMVPMFANSPSGAATGGTSPLSSIPPFSAPQSRTGASTVNPGSILKSTGSNGPTKKFKVGDPITQGTHKFKVTSVDSNGKVTDAEPIQ